MPSITLVRPALAKLEAGGDTVVLSDHWRSAFDISVSPIASEGRAVTGKLRRYLHAYKREVSVSWENLPGESTGTVDGHAGADELTTFIEAHRNEQVTLTFVNKDASETIIQVLIEDYTPKLTKRWEDDFYYDYKLSLKEI